MLRLLCYSNPQLDFVAAPALRPAEVEIDAAQQAIYEKELEAAAAAPLPDEVRSVANPLPGLKADRSNHRMTTSRVLFPNNSLYNISSPTHFSSNRYCACPFLALLHIKKLTVLL
jgi:hypothetical protein